MEAWLSNLETLLLVVFAACALVGAVLVLVLREPMRVAMALISTMVFLGGVYGLLGVHFIAAFQVLIYVGAVMVFIVYVIMLLDPRDSAVRRRFSGLLIPGVIVCGLFIVALGGLERCRAGSARGGRCWLHAGAVFSAVLERVLARVRADVRPAARGHRGCDFRHPGQPETTWISASMDKVQMLIGLSIALFAIGLTGVIIRRNVLVMLMCMELMLNGVILSLVTFAYQLGSAVGAVLVFLIFVVATAEIAIAIPIVLLLVRSKRTLDLDAYADLKG
jgi:NADH-quinone oxidoreductase subunit K